MENWAVLFTRTGAEEKLTQTLAKELNADEFSPFLPTKIMPRRTRSVIQRERKILFPGYVFIRTGIEAGLIAVKLRTAIAGILCRGDIYSLLHYGSNKNNVAMREKERSYWERLFDPEYCVNGSMGIIVNDVVRVTSGPLIGMESRIKKIDRHKRHAIVEMDVMGDVREVKLMLEIVEKISIGGIIWGKGDYEMREVN